MPVSYRFVRNSDNQTVPLSQIDDELREMLGAPPNSETFCARFETITNVGISVLFSDTSGVTKEKFDAWLEENGAKWDKEGVRHFLYEKYTFHAWR